MYFCLIIQLTFLKIFKTRLNYVEVFHKLLGLVLIESTFNASVFCFTYFTHKQVNQLKKCTSTLFLWFLIKQVPNSYRFKLKQRLKPYKYRKVGSFDVWSLWNHLTLPRWSEQMFLCCSKPMTFFLTLLWGEVNSILLNLSKTFGWLGPFLTVKKALWKLKWLLKNIAVKKTIITRGLYWCKLISCHSLRSITSNSDLTDSLHSQVKLLFSTHPMAFILLFCFLRLEFPQEPHSS